MKLVPKTSFEVDFGTPWDRQYVLDHQKNRLTTGKTEKDHCGNSQEETATTFYSHKSVNSETTDIDFSNKNGDLKSKELITELKLLQKFKSSSELADSQTDCNKSHKSIHENSISVCKDKLKNENLNHSEVRKEHDSIIIHKDNPFNISIKVTACDNPAFEHDTETDSQIVIDPQRPCHVTKLRLGSDQLSELEGQELSADTVIPDTLLSAYDPSIVSSTPAAKDENIFVIPGTIIVF